MKKIVPDPPLFIMSAAPILYSDPVLSNARSRQSPFLKHSSRVHYYRPARAKSPVPNRTKAHNVNVASASIQYALAGT